MNQRVGAALLVLLGGLSGCEQDIRAPLDFGDIVDTDSDCVIVIHERLELGVDHNLPIHRYVADRPSSAGGWALVTITNDAEQAELALVRVKASPEEHGTAPIPLGQAHTSLARIELRAGTKPGELWVLQDAGNNAAVRKLAPELGVLAENGSLANFPTVTGGTGCPSRFHRQLLFLDGRPFVLALPDCSDSVTLDLHLLELSEATMTFLSSWALSFDPSPGEFGCLLTKACVIDPIGPGESTLIADTERVAVGFTQVRDLGTGDSSSDVSLLELRRNPTGPIASLVTFRRVWQTPTDLGPVHVGQDPFSVHFHVRNRLGTGDAALFRLDKLGELYTQLTTSLPFNGAGRLVQLDSQAVMLNVANGALYAIPLIDVASWPDWRPRILMALDGLIDFEPAGVGQVLLRRAQAPPQVVQLRCLSAP